MGSGATKLSANMNLIQAVTDNKVEWVVKLVAEGADVNFASINNWTPLHYACKEGHACIVETLLTLGADRDLLTKGGKTANQVAEEKGHDECCAAFFMDIGSTQLKPKKEERSAPAPQTPKVEE